MSKETVEYQVNNKTIPKNTAILTERDIAINSKDCWGYAIRTRKILDIDDTELIVTDLIACCGNDPFTSCSDDPPTNIWISGFLAGEEGVQTHIMPYQVS